MSTKNIYFYHFFLFTFHAQYIMFSSGGNMKLSEWRKKQKMTQVELAEKLGCTKGHLSGVERGAIQAGRKMILNIIEVTGGKVGFKDLT
jgi:DNA-binding XRE family transcriptional regulator